MPAPPSSIQPLLPQRRQAVAVTNSAFYGDFNPRFDKREIIGAETYPAAFAVKTAGKVIKNTLEVGHGDTFIHGQSVYLMEHCQMCCIRGFVAVDSTGLDNRMGGFIVATHRALTLVVWVRNNI